MAKYNSKKSSTNLATFWVNLIFIIIPIIFTNYYFNILRTKTYTFMILASIFIILAMANALSENKLLSYFKLKSITDYAFVVFIVSAIISTLLSGEYILNAIWGNEGRYNGLILYALYFLTYIFIRKDFIANKKTFDIFIFISILVALFGITDFFDMNLFGFKDRLAKENWSTFYSTIGNINTYTAYLALPIGLSTGLFIFTDLDRRNIKSLVFYYISSFIFFVALIVGNSDNAYLSLFILFAFLPFMAFRHKESFFRYVLMGASLLLSVECVEWIVKLEGEKIIALEGVFPVLMEFKYFTPLLVASWILVIIIYFINKKVKDFTLLSRILTIVWTLLVISGFSVVIYFFYEANLTRDWDKYGSFSRYLIFYNEWGSHRGYIWRVSLEEYAKFTPIQKLFGYGLETFGLYMYNFKYDEMVRTTSFYFDSAHNEYIQYLFTHGLVGLISYILILVSALVAGFKKALSKNLSNEKFAIILALAYSIIAYATQAIVNINIPISSIFFFIFIMLLAGIANEDKYKS